MRTHSALWEAIQGLTRMESEKRVTCPSWPRPPPVQLLAMTGNSPIKVTKGFGAGMLGAERWNYEAG